MATILIIFLRSSVRCPAIDADHPLPPECNDNQQRLEDAEFCRAVERLSQRQETNSQWEGIPVSNGPRKNEYLKTSVRTGNDRNLFSLEALVCCDETEK